MINFHNISIQKKLVASSMLISIIALLLAGIAILGYDWLNHRQAVTNKMRILATVIGNRSIAALAFDDDRLAKDNLKALMSEPSIKAACIHTKTGALFASYSRDAIEPSCSKVDWNNQPNIDQLDQPVLSLMEFIEQPSSLLKQSLKVSHRISYKDGSMIGIIAIDSDLTELESLIKRDTVILLIIIVIAAIVAFVLSSRIQKLVSKPILHLSETAKQVSRNHNYSLRAVKQSEDELGSLVEAFNTMLSTIEQQNRALVHAKNKYMALYDDNPTMVFKVDLEGTIRSVNKLGVQQLAISLAELGNKSIFDFLHPDDKPLMASLLTKCIRQPEKIHKEELRMIRSDGNVISIRKTARLTHDLDGTRNIFMVCEDISEAKKLSEELSFHASHDALTGLVNRRAFENRLEQVLINAKADNSNNALCYLDLDQFKVVNDTCGHIGGDELLRQLVAVIEQKVRRTDLLARLGGDEFGILMEKCTVSQAERAANVIRQAVADFYFAWEDRSFKIGVSIGLVPLTANSISSIEIMKEADAACYTAKDRGRNRIHVYHHDDEEIAFRHGEMQWVSKINKALEDNRFELAFQPIVPVVRQANYRLEEHYEILVRMKGEDGSIIPPGAFLPAAERYDLSVRLDCWVVKNTLKWLKAHPEHVANLSVCAINLSGLTLGDGDFLGFVKEQFRQTRIPPNKICFEITETAAISNLSSAKRLIKSLKEEGCKFALDDFGSGLSSFAYLKNIPVDYVKIDGQFVKDIVYDPIDLTMVKSINELGHVMGKQTIAEFVENDMILSLLRNIGVDFAQGYGIGKPEPLSELINLEIVTNQLTPDLAP